MKLSKKFLSIFLILLSLLLLSFTTIQNPVEAVSTNYYASITPGATGTKLKNELRTLITSTHKYQTTYEDCKYPVKVNGKTYVNPDQDPNNPNNLILFWSGLSVPIKWDSGNTWNREHVWPKSNSWYKNGGTAYSDFHHIRPSDPRVNTVHNNNPYGIATGGEKVACSPANGGVVTDCKSSKGVFEPCNNRKGDVARIVFYLLTRYKEADSYTVNSSNVCTSLDLLLEWNMADPVDASEIWRNDAVEGIQGNRNPFIDNQNYANMIWNPNAPIENGYLINVDYNNQACKVEVSGKRLGVGYTGNVTIKVTLNEGYSFDGIFDKATNKMLGANLQYNINNIDKDYNIEVRTTKLGENPDPNPNPDPTPEPDPIDPTPITGNEFKQVMNTSELKVGDQIILVGKTTNGCVAMSTNQKKSNRGETVVTDNNGIITKSADTEVITLESGSITGTFAFKVTTGYLYAASSSSNHLKTQDNKDNDASWKVTINNGTPEILASGTNTHNDLSYNSSSNLFSCYASGHSQKTAYIYKLVTEFDKQIELFQKENTKTSILINYSLDTTTNQYTMIKGGIRFGTCITKEMYDAINSKGAIWGVEFFKGTGATFPSNSVKVTCNPARVANMNANMEDLNGNYYQFALVLTNMQYKDIDTFATARVYVTVDGTTYYMNQTSHSFREVVNLYLQIPDKSSFEQHIGILEHIRDYK